MYLRLCLLDTIWFLQFRCENGKVCLPLTGHDTGKSLTSFKDATTAGGLITCWKSTNFTDRTTVTSPTTSDVRTTPIRRPLEDYNSSPTTVLAPSKRMRCMEEDIDERIERCKRGIYIMYSHVIY